MCLMRVGTRDLYKILQKKVSFPDDVETTTNLSQLQRRLRDSPVNAPCGTFKQELLQGKSRVTECFCWIYGCVHFYIVINNAKSPGLKVSLATPLHTK